MGIDLAPYLDPSGADRARAEEIRARHAGPIWLGCGRLIYYKGFPVAVRALLTGVLAGRSCSSATGRDPR